MRSFFAAIVVLAAALPAAAQPWYARGEFNGWDTSTPMVDQGGGHYTATISGLFPSSPGAEIYNEFKVANADWSINMPGSNAKVATDANGEIHLHLYDQTSWSDGWSPNNARRVGYDDPQMYGWDLAGTFNGWQATPDPTYNLTSMGNGLYHGQFAMPAGDQSFKFRKQGDWTIAIGSDFGNTGADNSFKVWTAGDLWNFDLDLPNGRWRAYTDAPSPDLNNDNKVDARDYVIGRNNNWTTAGKNVWKANYGYGTAQDWYVRGSFNNFDSSTQMTNNGNGSYSAAVTGLTPGTDYTYRVTDIDSSVRVPAGNGNDGKVPADANGEIHFNFYPLQGNNWNDGWSPDTVSRVGYQDSQQYDWEIMGSFNGWTTPMALTDQGNGLHTGTFTFDAAGNYQFKFRKQGDWSTSIGDNFGNSAANITGLNVTSNTEAWTFELDLPHGKYRFYHPAPVGAGGAVPEPTSVALVLFGLTLGLGRVRRK